MAGGFLWGGLDNLIQEKYEEGRGGLKFVRMDVDGPCSDIILNMRDSEVSSDLQR